MSISKETLKINGCPLNGANPLPLFREPDRNKHPKSNGTLSPEELELFGYESAFRILPYTMQNRYDRNKKELHLETIVLENNYLRAEFLPAFGGRLYSLRDQKTKEELLFKNPVMQPANLAIRDAWFSGGIEWNIAQLGHTFTTCDHVFFSKVTADNDYEFLRMYDYERTRGLIWQIDFHLPENASVLSAHVTILNEQDFPVPMYWWTNIAARETPGCRVFSGTREVLFIEPFSQEEGAEHCFGHGQLPNIPSLPGADASYPLNFDYGNEYFFQNPVTDNSPWEAISYTDGRVFFERSTQPLRIRKMFCWGSHSGGRNWCDFLALPGQGDYVEIQAGLAPTQLHGMNMAGNSSISFTQIFGALTIPPDAGNAEDYEYSRKFIQQAVETQLPAATVLTSDAYYKTLSQTPCGEILHLGQGWGALENKRRTSEGRKTLPEHLNFPDSSLSPQQQWWLQLISGEPLPEGGGEDSPKLPLSWMTDSNYLPYLKRYEERYPKCSTALLHHGIIAYENGQWETAVSLWEQALDIKPQPILYRNLACAKHQKGDLEGALECMEQITWSEYLHLDYAFLQEYFSLMGEKQNWDRIFALFAKLPNEYQQNERLFLSACEAAMHLKKWDFLRPAFEREYASIREGETKITRIWLEYAKAHNISTADLPKNLDLRMFE